MRKIKVRSFVISAALCVLPPAAHAATKKFTCGSGKTIQAEVAKLKPGDTLLVTGTCNENVSINVDLERITIDGQGTTTINAADATRSTVAIRGRDITLTGFTITGGDNGVGIARGGTATITNCTIQGSIRDGIAVSQGSSVRVTNSTIQNNTNSGINVVKSSYARIGFLTVEGTDTIPGGVGPNTIQNNGAHGVRVADSSSADIIDNTISNNTANGVFIDHVSHALVASNRINGNGEDGIAVGRNSGVDLGRATGTDLDELPNSTTANNTGFGISCFINSYADGRLGTLNGDSGPGVQFNPASAPGFSGGCINALDP